MHDLTARNGPNAVDLSSDDEFEHLVLDKLQQLQHKIQRLALPSRRNPPQRPPPTAPPPLPPKKLQLAPSAVRNAQLSLSTIAQEKYIPTARSSEVNIVRIRELLGGAGGRRGKYDGGIL